MLDFERCELVPLMGRTRPVQVPLPRGTASRVPQIESLEAWAAKLLKPGMWWLRCAPLLMSGTSSEGVFWVLLVDSEAFPVPVDLVHSAAQYEEGWLVVRGRWFELEQRSPRGYKLKPAPRLIVVNRHDPPA